MYQKFETVSVVFNFEAFKQYETWNALRKYA